MSLNGHAASTTVKWCRPAGRVRFWQVKCQEPKTRQQKVQLYYEDDPLCPSGHIIYLLYSTLLAKKTGGGGGQMSHIPKESRLTQIKKSRKNIKVKMFYTSVLVPFWSRRGGGTPWSCPCSGWPCSPWPAGRHTPSSQPGCYSGCGILADRNHVHDCWQNLINVQTNL